MRNFRLSILPAVTAILFSGGCVTAQPSATGEAPKAAAQAETHATGGHTIKILAWNLEHFVDPYDSPYIQNPEFEDEGGPNKTMEDREHLAEALRIIDADVMVFEEVEDDRTMKLFLDSFLPGHDYKFYACVPSLEWYQNVAIVSKFPIEDISSLRETEMYNPVLKRTENKYNSRLLFADIRTPDGYAFTVGALHLKSGGDPEDPEWRKLQIELVHKHLEKTTTGIANPNIVVLGDMNFQPNSSNYTEMTTSKEDPLIDLFAEEGNPPTHPSGRPSSQIDHIFMSPGMAKELVPGSVAVAQPLPRKLMPGISDHLPVVVTVVAKDQ